MNRKATYTQTDSEHNERIMKVRHAFGFMYDTIEEYCKDSRETQEAFNRLEEAQFWAIKGISREPQEIEAF